MSISGSLSSALSGLNAASRAAEIVSSNVANALTDGYGRREIVLSARTIGLTGQGVRVVSVHRQSELPVTNDRRVADAGVGEQSARQAFLGQIETALGTPDQEGSLSGRIAALDTALLAGSAQPSSEARLAQIADAARLVATGLNSAADQIQTARGAADDQIENGVALLNQTLAKIADLNGQVRASSAKGQDPSALMDQRHQLVDSIATLIPLREVARDHGQVALVTTGGSVLLDGSPAKLEFTPAGVVTAEMSLGAGSLSGLKINGRLVATSGETSPIKGGSLAAQFAIRDDLAPQAQIRLDALARNLAERMSGPAVDPTLTSGQAGLFTDGPSVFDAANETGIASRISLNAAVDPLKGGELWRLRDGLAATGPGPSGNAAQISRWQQALTAPTVAASGGFISGARSFATMAADVISTISAARLGADGEVSFASARADALKNQELAGGVDTDQEMQSLLQIEQAYSANAKVIQTINDMMQTLLSM